jgi:hypothetical protein
MVSELCNLLKLNIRAGIGRRLEAVKITLDITNPCIFYIDAGPEVVEALSLADVLSNQAKMVQLSQYKFKAQRIAACEIN